MDNATFQRIKDLILKHTDVGVIVKPNPSLDEMAAGLGFYLVLKQMGKNVSIACPTDPLVAVSSLVGIDKVQKTLGSGIGGDLVVSFPYKEGEIEKVSYTLDNGFLNITVKAGEKGLSFNDKDVAFNHGGGNMPTLLFFIGVAHLSDVASLYNPAAAAGVEIVNMDNKPDNEKYGNVVVVDQKWSSVSEQVADFVTLLEPQIELDADTAQNLLNGIDFATTDFTSPRTSYLAFEVAGILMKKGATRQKAQNIGQSTSAPAMPNVEQYFPPQPKVQPAPVQQPVAQPSWQPTSNVTNPQSMNQPFDQIQGKPVQPTQQVSQPVQQPVQPQQPFGQTQGQPVQQPQQVQQPFDQAQGKPFDQSQSNPQEQTPPDWLTPKVYKGSTVL